MGFDQNVVQGPPDPEPAGKCLPTFLTPDTGASPLTVFLQTNQAGGHIFYRLSQTGANPTHSGDNATGNTVRIGGTQGQVHVQSGLWFLKTLTYRAGYLDSDIKSGDYATDTGR